jgi:hypothetical protein
MDPNAANDPMVENMDIQTTTPAQNLKKNIIVKDTTIATPNPPSRTP